MNAPESNLTTALGIGPICGDCLDAGAECPKALHQAYIETKASGARFPREIANRVTIHIGDNRYLPLKEFYEKATQLPVPCQPREPAPGEDEDQQLFGLVCLMLHVTPSLAFWPRFKTPSLLVRIMRFIQEAIYGPHPVTPEERPK